MINDCPYLMVDLNSGHAIVQVREVPFDVQVQTLKLMSKVKILKHACLLTYDTVQNKKNCNCYLGRVR